MMFTNARRLIKFGLVNFWRNRWPSVAAILVLTLTLITITISAIQNFDIQRSIDSIKDRLDLVVYFKDEVSEQEISELQYRLKARPEVKSIDYVSKEDALKVWQTRPTSNQIKELVTAENNILPRSIQIKTDDPASLETIAKLLQDKKLKDKIRRVSYQDNKKIIQDLIEKNEEVKRTGMISSITFVVISLVVIINTIRTIMLTRKEEIEIMRLVGASAYYIQAPFLVEATLTAFIAALLSLVYLYIGVVFDQPIVPSFISRYFTGFTTTASLYELIYSHLWIIFLIQFGIAFILTTITSFITMRRYLRI